MAPRPKVTKEIIENTCEELLGLGLTVDDITFEKVTERLGAKGNTQNTLAHIRTWKSKQNANNETPSSTGNTLNDLLHGVEEEINRRVQSKSAILEEKYLTQIDDLTAEIVELNEELVQLREFKSSFSKILDSEKARANELQAQVGSLSSELAVSKSKVAELTETHTKSTAEISRLQQEVTEGVTKYLTFIDAQNALRSKDVDKFEHALEKALIEHRATTAKLNQTEEALFIAKSKSAEQLQQLENANDKIKSLEEQQRKQTALEEQIALLIDKSTTAIKGEITQHHNDTFERLNATLITQSETDATIVESVGVLLRRSSANFDQLKMLTQELMELNGNKGSQ